MSYLGKNSNMIHFRVSEWTMKQLDLICRETGLSLSDVCRRLLMKTLFDFDGVSHKLEGDKRD